MIAQIGGVRQEQRPPFVEIHADLPGQVPISEAEVHYLYQQQYLPLLACLERQQFARLSAVAAQTGLRLSLDGLAPEGGEPQLWGVRDLKTGCPVRSGWLSQQDQATFSSFLQPLAAQGWRVRAILSDKQRGLEPAVTAVFPAIPHAWWQLHYLHNAAAPGAAAVEQLKVTLLRQAGDWLQQVAALLDPAGQPQRTGAQVRGEFAAYLAQIKHESAGTPRLHKFSAAIAKVSRNYAPGLSHTDDVPGLPRTNNDRSSEFRSLNRRLLRTTGQKGLTRRILQRSGAWAHLPHPSTLADTTAALARIATPDLRQEQQRVCAHRGRFRLHTHAAKQAQLAQLVERCATLPAVDGA